jgi:hypothetical protein
MSLVKALFFDKLKEFFRVHLHIEIHDIVHNLVTVNHIHYHGSQLPTPNGGGLPPGSKNRKATI